MSKIVHIIGTGTIGEPLVGMLADHKVSLGIDEVTFHKRTPLREEIAKVNSLIRRGAKLCTDDNDKTRAQFQDFGHEISYGKREALKRATVVIDCTPTGNANKESIYEYLDGPDGFLAQGSEKGFGPPYALDINESILEGTKFVQIVSCNTHNISALLAALGFDKDSHKQPLRDATCRLKKGTFLCIRRANDVSQDKSFIASPEVGIHSDEQFGTHHARDAYDLFSTIGYKLPLWSSAMKINTQYMHSMWFSIRRENCLSMEDVITRLESYPGIAMTYKRSSNKVFSFGRDHGYYGRILNQTVIAKETLAIDGDTINGFCFTPQDGNSLLSSVSATMKFLHGREGREKLKVFSPYLFSEI